MTKHDAQEPNDKPTMASVDGNAEATESATKSATESAIESATERNSIVSSVVLEAASPPSTGPESFVGRMVGDRYRLERLLGSGGMGSVYLAEHVHMRKRVALKVLHPEMTRIPEVVARFEREAMAAGNMDHPHVAAATDFGTTDEGAFYLVLEYVPGKSLRSVLRSEEVSVGRALRIGKQMAEALERAHELGIVHRDLKPDNVMLVERQGDPDFVKVLDFGIAKVPVDELPSMQPSPGSNPDKPLTRVGRIYGTPEYMAPEQAAGEVVDARADLYALGIVLYEMLSGRRPFESESLPQMLAMQLTAKPPRFSEKCPSRAIPAKVEALVFAMLEKDPAVRPASAKAVREQLEELLREGATPTLGGVAGAHGRDSASRWERWEKEPSTTDKETRGSRWPMRYGAAFGLGALTLALVYGVTRPKPDTKTPPLAVSEKTVEESSRASAQALQQASAAGTEALAALADQFPEDPAILRALVLAYRRDKQWAIAVHTAKSWVRLVGAATDDDEVTDAIVAAAQNGGEAQEPALELLASSLGGRGVEELYELATSTKGGALKAKAWAQVSKAEVRDRASRATAFLIEFRTANGCEARRGLLARARSEADGRALVLLKPLAYPKGCGFLGLSDCHPCFRKEPFRSELKETLALLESKRTPPSK